MADIQVYKRVIDYVGLGAKPIPERSLALFRELAPVLALMQGMGPDGARLLGSGTTAGPGLDINLTQIAGLPPTMLTTNVPAFGVLFNDGVALSRASAGNLGNFAQLGTAIVSTNGEWGIVSAPAVGQQATITRAAGGGTVRHICRSLAFAASSLAAPVATALNVTLRDGLTGAGTILWQQTLVVLAAAGQNIGPFGLSGLNIVGSANTAMTLEWNAALANLFESVSLSGFDAS